MKSVRATPLWGKMLSSLFAKHKAILSPSQTVSLLQHRSSGCRAFGLNGSGRLIVRFVCSTHELPEIRFSDGDKTRGIEVACLLTTLQQLMHGSRPADPLMPKVARCASWSEIIRLGDNSLTLKRSPASSNSKPSVSRSSGCMRPTISRITAVNPPLILSNIRCRTHAAVIQHASLW